MKNFVLQKDGSLRVADLDAEGNGTVWNIQPEAIAAHRRDPEFEAELPADVKAALAAPGGSVAP